MEEIKQRSEILAPFNVKVLKYNGDNPSKVLKVIPNLIKSIFRVTSTNFYEDIFKWDNVSENNDFYAAWRGKFTEDARTALWADVKVQGVQNENTKKGNVTIWLRAYLITKFEFTNPFMKALLKIYSYYFYSNQRIMYSERARQDVALLEKEIRAQLGM